MILIGVLLVFPLWPDDFYFKFFFSFLNNDSRFFIRIVFRCFSSDAKLFVWFLALSYLYMWDITFVYSFLCKILKVLRIGCYFSGQEDAQFHSTFDCLHHYSPDLFFQEICWESVHNFYYNCMHSAIIMLKSNNLYFVLYWSFCSVFWAVLIKWTSFWIGTTAYIWGTCALDDSILRFLFPFYTYLCEQKQ